MLVIYSFNVDFNIVIPSMPLSLTLILPFSLFD
jgi:hypothetical protein